MKTKNISDRAAFLIKQEEELKKLRKQSFLIFKNVSDGITVQNRKGIIFANQASLEFTKVSLNKSTKNFKYFNEKGISINWNNLPAGRVLNEKVEVQGLYKVVNKKTGEEFWLNIKSMPIFDQDKKLIEVITISRNITSHMLEDEMKNNFLRLIAHELRTPITSIKAFSQILERMNNSSKDKKTMKYFQKMDIQISKLSDLIDTLLNVTKLKQKIPFKDKWFSFDLFVKKDISEIQKGLNKHKLILIGKTSKKFFGDKEKISQILKNMINNAVKYSPRGKKVIITLSGENNSLKVAVRDFGIGISPRHHKKIFKQFYRIYGKKENLFPGVGIGLSVSKEIADRYGAKMWVKSREGKGSIFFLSLPVRKSKKL